MRATKHLCSGLFTSAVFLFLALFAGTNRSISAQRRHSPAALHPPAHTLPPAPHHRRARTPYERIFAPGVARSLKAGGTKQPEGVRTTARVVPEAEQNGNFGGYHSDPLYPACVVNLDEDDYCSGSWILAADFNKDGKQDLAALSSTGALASLLGDGNGGFAAPIQNYDISNIGSLGFNTVINATVADMDGDGYPDIVALINNDEGQGGDTEIAVYLNQKDGTFKGVIEAGEVTLLDPNDFHDTHLPYQFAVGDVNGDGIPDVVEVTYFSNETGPKIGVVTFLGTGGGKLATPSLSPLIEIVSVPPGINDWSVALGDLNGDGRLDLAIQREESVQATPGVVKSTMIVSFNPGNGDGTFSGLGASANPVISVPFPDTLNEIDDTRVHIADLNNDGNPDIVMGFNGIVYAAFSNGNGTFQSQKAVLSTGSLLGITFTDMNNDGKLDMVVGYINSVGVFDGVGDGTFDPIGSYALLNGPFPTVADFNGDGKLDIAGLGNVGLLTNDVENFNQDVMVVLGNGDGTLAGTPLLAWGADPMTPPQGFQLMATGDVNGDGNTDVVLNDSHNSLAFYFPAANQNDLVTGLSDGKGNFTYKHALSTAANANLGYIEPTTADFNGDGKQDILFVGADNTLSVALSRGDGTFADPVSVGLPALQCEVTYSPAGDLNGDGKMDIVAPYPGDASCGGSGSMPSGVFVLLGKGDGTFTLTMFCPLGSELYSAALADFNGDGKLDLLLNDTPFNVSGTFRVSLFLGNGDGTFQTEAKQVSTGYAVSQMIAGDFNQDGKMDLMLLTAGNQGVSVTSPNFTTAGVLLLPGNGDGTFGDFTTIAAGNFFSTGAFEDVNGDGIPDLTLAQENFEPSVGSFLGLATLLGVGDGTFSNPISTFLPSNQTIIPSDNFNIVLPGNFYADNAPDFVVGTPGGPALFLGLGGSAMSLTASAASIMSGNTETLTATLTPSMFGRPTPTGQVTFYDGTTMLGQSSLSGGTASFASSSLSVGSHTITATYGGDSNTNANSATAGSITVTALAPAFTVTASPSTLTIAQGQSGTATLTVTANAAFNGAVSFRCGALPANASCTFSPSSLAITAGKTGSVSLVVNTSAQPSTSARGGGLSTTAAGLFAACLLLVSSAPIRRRRRWMVMVLAFVLVYAAGSLSGCGNGHAAQPMPVAPTGSSTVTISAADSSGSTSQTASFTLVIN